MQAYSIPEDAPGQWPSPGNWSSIPQVSGTTEGPTDWTDGICKNRGRESGSRMTQPERTRSGMASELFARLLLELPEHRRELQSAGRDGDSGRLTRAAHKLLGAVVYCNLPELADALRKLKGMAESGHTAQTKAALNMVLRLIDELLTSSGYGGT